MYYTVDEEATMILVAVIVLIVYLALICMGLANYIMSSLALYKIGSRRQIPNSWLAWVPVGSSWLIGNIADDYDERNGIKRKWRVVLLVLTLISIGGIVVGYIGMMVSMVRLIIASENYMDYASAADLSQMIGALVFLYVVIILAAIVAATKGFCNAVCIYKIFESTVPEKAVKYFLLYLLVPLAGSICLLKCKDKGYSKEIVPVAGYPVYPDPVQEEIPEKTDSEE